MAATVTVVDAKGKVVATKKVALTTRLSPVKLKVKAKAKGKFTLVVSVVDAGVTVKKSVALR